LRLFYSLVIAETWACVEVYDYKTGQKARSRDLNIGENILASRSKVRGAIEKRDKIYATINPDYDNPGCCIAQFPIVIHKSSGSYFFHFTTSSGTIDSSQFTIISKHSSQIQTIPITPINLTQTNTNHSPPKMIQILPNSPPPKVNQIIPPNVKENEDIDLIIVGHNFANPIVRIECEQSGTLWEPIVKDCNSEMLQLHCNGLPSGTKRLYIKNYDTPHFSYVESLSVYSPKDILLQSLSKMSNQEVDMTLAEHYQNSDYL